MTTKILIIAEKPSVAGDLAKVLPGKFTKQKTHYESDSHIVSYAVGHLVSLCYPEEIDPIYQKWGLANLPILPESFPLKAVENTKSQLNALKKLIRRKDVTEIINACDAGREGELIFKYILKYVWNTSVAKKTIKRLWLQSMTAESIKKGFNNLRENDTMQSLEDAALCRSESDWLIGLNATRALTGFNSRKGGFFLTPCGRVQTPTLSLIVKREAIRNGFTPTDYNCLQANFSFETGSYSGKWIDPNFKKDPKNSYLRQDRIWDKQKALAILEKCQQKPANATENSKESRQSAPQLFDLTALQREANSRFGFSAKNTLGIAQALYEKHKALTYPRTDSRHLPEDYVDTVKEITQNQTGWEFAAIAKTALKEGYIKAQTRIFNNKKISDHHAIIPTNTLPQNLSEPELKIYTMVVQRFLAIFFPPAVFHNTKRYSLVEGQTFLTEGKILLEAGWKVVYAGADGSTGKDKILAPIPTGSPVTCNKIEKEALTTTPPARYNEATLLSAMENSDKFIENEELADAMKERGLGTPATRATIIEKLIKEKYVVREAKDLVPTGKAFELFSLIEAMKIDTLASPEMTGEWEYKLNQIFKGEMTRDDFMQEIRQLTQQIVDRVRDFNTDEERSLAPFSPVGETVIYSTPTAWVSEDGTIAIRKVLGGRLMSNKEIVALLEGKSLGPFSDWRSKRGKNFTATVSLKNNKIEFIFADSTADLDIDSIKKQEPLGLSPVDQTAVFETPVGYMSESALDGESKKGLKISKVILDKTISKENIQQLLTDGKTELIQGFISKRKRPFDAYLLMDKKGKITFEFPPRKPKNKPQD
ncbi:DNA topoisomerase III [Desulfotalea psychrophila]|uniref:DNA topoisomerase n=1 Tax=Desulfotalea psychrophila (strain LSv54 / DSM 12343) TaxID=177439 RepID=Q6AJY0_DESPS|nr:DNA topoisomerase III [Desulfotalea psychrophila]CAG37346.1 probable DNA topoisomerase III [Desulfotalea psychrophila LSv54]